MKILRAAFVAAAILGAAASSAMAGLAETKKVESEVAGFKLSYRVVASWVGDTPNVDANDFKLKLIIECSNGRVPTAQKGMLVGIDGKPINLPTKHDTIKDDKLKDAKGDPKVNSDTCTVDLTSMKKEFAAATSYGFALTDDKNRSLPVKFDADMLKSIAEFKISCGMKKAPGAAAAPATPK